MRRFRLTTVAVEKTISNTYSECVVLALRISYPPYRAHAPCFFLSTVTHLAVPYFSTFSHKRHNTRKYWI